MKANIITDLYARGFIDSVTGDELKNIFAAPQKVYVGFDPTADSLHLGNLLGIIALRWFQMYGHTPVIVMGGATAKIGDPSGRDKERPLLDEKIIENNIQQIERLFHKLLADEGKFPKPIIINNDSWLSAFSFIEFLRDVGKLFRLGPMLAKESVKQRLQSEEGMSFTEFTYQMLQGYDFYYLNKEYGVALQMGGSDQWGNITAGIEFTRKLSGNEVNGLTFPLLLGSDGKKFGKSVGGAIWLDSDKCSAYEFYQYLIKVSDEDVIKLLKRLTFLPVEQIEKIEKQMQSSSYVPNSAQKLLAQTVTRFVHGQEGLETAEKVTEAAKPGQEANLDPMVLKQIAKDFPTKTFSLKDVIGKKYTDIMAISGIVTSKGEACRLVKNNGAYLNNQKIQDLAKIIQDADVIDGSYLLLGAGKKKKLLLQLKA